MSSSVRPSNLFWFSGIFPFSLNRPIQSIKSNGRLLFPSENPASSGLETATEIAQVFQVPVTVGKTQMAPVNAGPDQGSFPPKVPFSTPVSILLWPSHLSKLTVLDYFECSLFSNWYKVSKQSKFRIILKMHRLDNTLICLTGTKGWIRWQWANDKLTVNCP